MTLTRLHWIAATSASFDLHTDHNNLVFIFDFLQMAPDLSQLSVLYVLRWAVKLSLYNYVCYSIRQEDIIWADLFGRWSPPPVIRRLLEILPLPSSSDANSFWPNVDHPAQAPSKYAHTRPPQLALQDGHCKNSAVAVWVPATLDYIQLRVCIIAHASAAGLSGQLSTESSLRKKFFGTPCQQISNCWSTPSSIA